MRGGLAFTMAWRCSLPCPFWDARSLLPSFLYRGTVWARVGEMLVQACLTPTCCCFEFFWAAASPLSWWGSKPRRWQEKWPLWVPPPHRLSWPHSWALRPIQRQRFWAGTAVVLERTWGHISDILPRSWSLVACNLYLPVGNCSHMLLHIMAKSCYCHWGKVRRR